MSNWNYDVIIPREAEEVFDYTISGGESLLLYGVEDFSEIVSWINLADLTLEFVPSCRESLHTCIDWFGSNRERVEVTLAILRDARSKVHDFRYAALLGPSRKHRMLIERVCGRGAACGSPYHPTSPGSLSCRDFSSEGTNESKSY
jgi:hypothetical protein